MMAEPEAGSIEALNQIQAVKEVRAVGSDGDEHAVLIEGEQTYRDFQMQHPSSRVLLPQAFHDWLDASQWEAVQTGFYTHGDNRGCFGVRIQRDASKHTVTWNVSPAESRLQVKISLGGFTTKTGPLPRKYASKLHRILDAAPGCSAEQVGFWSDEGDGTN